MVYSEDFSGEGFTTDGYGHGTHVAGILSGNGRKSTGSGYSTTITGVATGARLINLKALGSDGQGSDSSVIAAINQAIALKDSITFVS